jgi:hypothetical protein
MHISIYRAAEIISLVGAGNALTPPIDFCAICLVVKALHHAAPVSNAVLHKQRTIRFYFILTFLAERFYLICSDLF